MHFLQVLNRRSGDETSLHPSRQQKSISWVWDLFGGGFRTTNLLRSVGGMACGFPTREGGFSWRTEEAVQRAVALDSNDG